MGVKSLWSLLTPVGRPVMLETVEGKIMAIDSSIWLYQFQATMRDKEGRGLVNAHVLGFLRRITKLLFYGIKPVFVFDGGAPVLKRQTLNDRKKKKSGAAETHAKVAEKLLAAHLRREAVNHTRASKGKGKEKAKEPELDEDTVYLEDIDPSVPKAPKNPKPPSSVSPKKRWDQDPYSLPDVDLREKVSEVTTAMFPDPRLATEEDLRAFIEEMRPEDFDVTSPDFRELPTEVQYEIIGDLRLKSRQTSYARLQNMLKNSQTPLDFSKQQIRNLKQRNSLTQQLLVTTDSIGKAHISIPIRIASERNRQYVLVKNEGEEGGWILALRDTGTKEKPIVVDGSSDNEAKVGSDDDDDMEEVDIPQIAPDPDLLEYRRQVTLDALAKRYPTEKPKPRPKAPVFKRNPGATPLFELSDDELPQVSHTHDSEDEDDEIAYAVQVSLDQARSGFREVSISPKAGPSTHSRISPKAGPSTLSRSPKVSPHRVVPSTPTPRQSIEDRANIFGSSTRLETALSFANTRPTPLRTPIRDSQQPVFGKPQLLGQPGMLQAAELTDSDEDMDMVEILPQSPVLPPPSPASVPVSVHVPSSNLPVAPPEVASESDDKLEEVPITSTLPKPPGRPVVPNNDLQTSEDEEMDEIQVDAAVVVEEIISVPELLPEPTRPPSPQPTPARTFESFIPTAILDVPAGTDQIEEVADEMIVQPSIEEDEEDEPIPWSRSPSPSGRQDIDPHEVSAAKPQDWDAAQEMDVQAEEGEFARFLSQVKGKNLDEVQREIDDEIKYLNEQRKAAMRDSEDITKQMINQIMTLLRLFGIPYITAPMEAEAQCAELASLGLVDGVITDDSDVFLFGAQRVFKNMFNQSKTVECFLQWDLSRELGLDRDTLVRLAFLLGSDYTDGLPGVGPVVAMELLKEFPGEDGLHKFKEWWTKVQMGRDNEEDNNSKFRRQFKKKFKKLYLSPEWPNAAVRDAYYHPTVDSSDEPFKWGLPDLDALREFLRRELGWHQSKVDDLLLPIIQKINRRGQEGAVNKQNTLTSIFGVQGGSGTLAPRKRQTYTSKRLQDVVTAFRKNRKSATPGAPPSDESAEQSVEEEGAEEPPKKKSKTKSTKSTRGKGGTATRGRGRGRGRGKAGTTSAASTRGGKKAAGDGTSKRKKRKEWEEDESEDDESAGDEFVGDGSESDGEIGTNKAAQPAESSQSLSVELRPRPKPRPAHKKARTEEVEPSA
ncbi:PIN domain-like protein [Pluteus cervinus]|uniref:PIN domain-like protein n=1 Tax=Pluteus cervinus TaxID=181527 RepID=A0ACD3AYI2_9AGAR|nr:PIN domain-like protein [Pluteus cervinus]